ncbi:MAG: hypothetical protein QF898_12250 [SAR202 cluster bacterium]|jgi:uncharacterized protein YbaR (Trm112 family)|nr:hypothetical protein [SAR202 cluster bacterium]MDP6512067.1 hypothetical protein [SAR202 cluster bacterium]MDP6716809.1 hypothetical protein [SAR202 cluster bacterium]
MHEWILQILRCPQCSSRFELTTFTSRDDLTVNGVLVCVAPECGSWFPVHRGVPRMLSSQLMGDFLSEFMDEHNSQMSLLGLSDFGETTQADDMSNVKLGVGLPH